MTENRERRRDPRVQVQVRMEVTDSETGRQHVLLTTNLSCGGARCTALSAPRPGATLQGSMFLPLSEAGRDVDVVIPVTARVLGVERTHNGSGEVFSLAFDTMQDHDRAELASYLFAWLADDCFIHITSEVGACS